ncbi:MAG: phosphate acetyltransferase [Brevinemataceae bacterium]
MPIFSDEIIERAKSQPKKLILPEGIDPRVLQAAEVIIKEKIASEVSVLGNPDKINALAKENSVNLSQINIIDFEQDPRLEEFAHEYYEQRKHKGLSEEEALKEMKDDVFFGGKLLSKDLFDGMVSGSFSPTSKTLRAAIFFGRPIVKTISGVFVMQSELKHLGVDGKLIFGDCAVVPNPTPEQLADIAIGCAQTAKTLLQADPKVALLSFSTKGSAKSPETEKVIKAVEILKERNVDFEFDGELQLDAAIHPTTATLKAPGSCIQGKANVLVFPNLEAGNIGYKLVQRFGSAQAYGPLLQGLEKSINDLSRGCSYQDIITISAITLAQSAGNI